MEQPFTQLSSLVPALAHGLEPLLDRPFAIFGHSLGALVGFELARYLLRQLRTPPVCLFVSGGRAPHIPPRHRAIHKLPADEFLDELRRMNGTPGNLLDNAELMAIMLPVLRADFAVFETYAYTDQPPLDCLISGFGGLQDDRVSRGDLEAWRDQTSVAFSLRMFPGDHFFVNTARPLLLQMLSHDLHKAA